MIPTIILQGSGDSAVAVIFLLLLLPIIVPAVWVSQDAKANSDDPAYLWALVVLFAPFLGLLLYFLLGRHRR